MLHTRYTRAQQVITVLETVASAMAFVSIFGMMFILM